MSLKKGTLGAKQMARKKNLLASLPQSVYQEPERWFSIGPYHSRQEDTEFGA